MADGHFPTLVSATRDANATANPMFVQLTDGTDLALIDASGNLGVTFSNTSIAVTATDLDIRDLTHVSDSVKIGDGTDFLAVAADGSIAVTDNGGSLTVDGTVAATQSGAWTVAATQSGTWNIGTVTSITNAVTIQDGGNVISIDDAGGSLTVDGSVSITGSVTVTATDLDIRDLTHVSDSVKVGDGTDLLAINNDGSINVNVVSASAGTAVHDHKIASAVASDSTDNHDYTAGAAALLLKQVTFASSGGSKAVLTYDPSGTPKVIWTGFIPKEGGEKAFILQMPFTVAATKVIRIAVTNRQGQAQDLYSTIEAEQL
jgi:hypothetical protein